MADQGGTGLSIGSFDIGVEVVENRIRVRVLERMVESLMRQSNLNITQEEVDRLRKEAIDELNEKYPELGVEQQ